MLLVLCLLVKNMVDRCVEALKTDNLVAACAHNVLKVAAL